MVKLGDICKKVTNINSDFIGEIDYIDISSIDNERKSIVSTQKLDFSEAPSRAKQLVLPGDILISNVRPNLNAVAMIISDKSNTLVASTGYTVIRCNNNAFNRYVFFFCQYFGFVDLLVSQATGASYPAVNASIIKNTIIPLPALEKQHQIAKNLDTLQSIITHRRTQLEKLDLLVKARFVEMFDLNTCEFKTLGECTDFVDYRGHTPKLSDKGTIRMVNAKSVGKGFFKYVDEYITEETYDSWMHRGFGYPGDILFVTEGHTFGNTCLIPKDMTKFALGQRVITIKGHDEIKNAFLCSYMQTDMFWKGINVYKTGGTAQGIRSKDLIKVPVPIPDITKQTQFADFVKQVDKSKATVQKALDEAQLLFDSLMQEYFG